MPSAFDRDERQRLRIRHTGRLVACHPTAGLWPATLAHLQQHRHDADWDTHARVRTAFALETEALFEINQSGTLKTKEKGGRGKGSQGSSRG